MTKLSLFGVGVTILYFCSLGYLLHTNWEGFLELAPNEWGDFVAGSLGPLAIFWVVLGFFQQGTELKNSVATLELQAKELANSVEQQRELVQVTRESYLAEQRQTQEEETKRKTVIKPRFEPTAVVGSAQGQQFKYQFRFLNHGGDASNVSLTISPRPFQEIFGHQWPFVRKGDEKEVCLQLLESGIREDLIWCFRIEFRDADGDFHEQTYRVKTPPREEGITLRLSEDFAGEKPSNP